MGSMLVWPVVIDVDTRSIAFLVTFSAPCACCFYRRVREPASPITQVYTVTDVVLLPF